MAKNRSAGAVAIDSGAARVDSGRALMKGTSGRWAGEQLLRALSEGRELGPAVLRTADTLRRDEWVAFDEAVIEEGMIRLRGVADLIAAGLTLPIAGAMGKTMVEYEKMADMQDAIVSLSGVDRSEDDRVDFTQDQIPLPITHKDFDLNLRTLIASRTRGEALDTTQARVSSRKVSEMLEYMLYNGGKTFLGKTIYGYTSHPDRNLLDYATAGETWDAAGKTGEEILTDVRNAKARLEAERFFGPYWLYVPSAASTKLDDDFKSNSDKTIRQRIGEVDGIQKIQVVDQIPAGHVVLTQASRDVVVLVTGQTTTVVQWDIEGGFVIKFKVFAIQVPLLRSTSATSAFAAGTKTKQMGVVDMFAQ